MTFSISRIVNTWNKAKQAIVRFSLTVEDGRAGELEAVLAIAKPLRRESPEAALIASYLEERIALLALTPLAVTFDGCIAGNNERGLWAWPSQVGRYKTTTWNKPWEAEVLRRLRVAGELGGRGEEQRNEETL